MIMTNDHDHWTRITASPGLSRDSESGWQPGGAFRVNRGGLAAAAAAAAAAPGGRAPDSDQWRDENKISA